MKTFYTIIKIAPNVMADDSISIGLLVSNGRKFWLKFSEDKKNISKRLLEDNSGIVDFLTKQLKTFFKSQNEELRRLENDLFPLEKIIKSNYFEYLNRYSNGILQFSKPSLLDDDFSDDKFIKLFSLFIDKNFENSARIKSTSDLDFKDIISNLLLKPVTEKIHVKCKFNSKNLSSIYFQYELDCIGLNGAFVGAKSISFDKTHSILDKDISHYIALISLLTSKYNKDIKKNNFFLITREPVITNSPEHKLWEGTLKNPLYKVINPEQSFLVTNKVMETNATKFLESI